jgi:hypothetical protein
VIQALQKAAPVGRGCGLRLLDALLANSLGPLSK